jgi:hypothetical protein
MPCAPCGPDGPTGPVAPVSPLSPLGPATDNAPKSAADKGLAPREHLGLATTTPFFFLQRVAKAGALNKRTAREETITLIADFIAIPPVLAIRWHALYQSTSSAVNQRMTPKQDNAREGLPRRVVFTPTLAH